MKDYQSLIQDAKAHLVQRRFDLALETASEAIRAEPKQAMPYLIRAEAARKLGLADRALADVAVAIRIEPNRASPYVIRAEILKKRCLFDQAIADATHAILLDPDNAAAFSVRTDCRLAIGDADGAAFDAQELFRIDPTRPPSIAPSPPIRSKQSAEPIDYASKDTMRAAQARDASVFADGKPVDRSLKSRKATADDAAEVLVDASGYRPGDIALPLPRTRTPKSRSGIPAPLIVVAIGVFVLLGTGILLTRSNQHEVQVQGRAVEVGKKPVTPETIPTVAVSHRWEPPPIAAYPESSFTPLFGGRTIDRPMKDMSNCTPESFTDFVLRFEYRLLSHNSQPWTGLRLRHGGTSRRLSVVLSEGMSGGLLLDQSLPDLKMPLIEERLDDVHRIIKPALNAEKPFGEWNRCEVVCDGSRTTVAINDQVVNDIPNGPHGVGMVCLAGSEGEMAIGKVRIMKLGMALDSAHPAQEVKPIRQLKVSVGVNGECNVVVNAINHDAGHEPQQGELTLLGITDARVVKGENGTFRITHLFREAKGTADFALRAGAAPQPLQGISLNKGDGTLVLTPVPSPGEQEKKAVLSYPRYFKIPIALTLDLENLPSHSTLVVQVEKSVPYYKIDEKLAVRVGWNEKSGGINATWHPLDRKKSVTLFQQDFMPGRLSEHTFQLPHGAITAEDRCALTIGYFSPTPAAIRSLVIDAKVIPMLGVEWAMDRSKGGVVVKSVFKGLPAERAGLLQGDIVDSIGGKQVRELKEAQTLLGQTQVGDNVKIVIRRVGGKVEVSLKVD